MQKLAAAIVAVVGFAHGNYLSGEVRSQEWFTYGKFVAKMQNPGKMGTVQSFFTYTAQDWPHGWNEIDVEVVPSVHENPFSMNIIWRDGAQDHNYATGFHPNTDWVTYTIEWTPEYVSWFVNDKLVRKTEGTEDVHFLDQPTQLMMNFWTPTWSPWNDYFDDAEMPWYAKYDFVEVYDYNMKTKDFKLRWRDDFNTFDEKKWYASDNWGFENNSSLFMGSQAYVEDGNLVLKMDYNDGHAHHWYPHHQAPSHTAPAHHEAPHAAAPVHHEAPHAAAPVHHEAAHTTAVHHEAAHVAAPVHHEAVHATAVHHEAPIYHKAAHHEAHHQDVDISHYEAPTIHHSAYDHGYDYPSDYSHEYSHGYDQGHHETSYHGYAEHEQATTHEFKHGYHEGEYPTQHYETIRYGAETYPHHSDAHHYRSPAAEVHDDYSYPRHEQTYEHHEANEYYYEPEYHYAESEHFYH